MRKLFLLALMIGGCPNEERQHEEPKVQEWEISKSGSPIADEHVVTVKGHGRICYVFVEDMNSRNAAALLWCEAQ